MPKLIVDPGPIVRGPGKIVGPGKDGPPEFVKVEIDEGWPAKWVGLDEVGESDPSGGLLEVLDRGDVEGLLLPAVQKMSEDVPFTFLKIDAIDSAAFDGLVEEGAFDDFDDLLVLNPEGERAGIFLKIEGVKGESHDTQDTGAWTPLAEPDTDLF